VTASLPRWAWWNPVGAERPWTVGIEEEVMLLDPHDLTLANRVDDVLASLPADLPGQASAETHACAVELAGRPHARVAAAAADLAGLRRTLARTLGDLRLCAAVAGTHPFALWSDVEASTGPRYRRIRASMRELAHREPTFALHVHVAVPDGEAAVRALDGLRRDLPLLLALSANSPYWQGRDTGLASARTPIFSMFPRVGIARRFASYDAYVGAVDGLVAAGAVPDQSFLWWDARLRPHLGTVEVRIMDAQTQIADAAALAALVQCLVWLGAEGALAEGAPAPEALAENRFLASRDGIAARFVEAGAPPMRPAVVRLGEVLEACRPIAARLGCGAELEAVAALAERPGHARQRSAAEDGGLVAVTSGLRAELGPAASRPRVGASSAW
jgi:glutamate---cysteine ligase / carboxylate-amine ligase